MQSEKAQVSAMFTKDLTDVLIRIGVIAVLVVWTSQIIDPFLSLLLWSLILAVTLYPLHQRLAKRLGNRQGRAATALVLAGMLVIGIPTALLGSSFASYIHELHTTLSSETVAVEPPAPSVAEWPLIGEQVYALWNSASQDLPAFLERMQPQLKNLTEWLLLQAASTAGAVALFLFALIVAGVMMAYGESGSRAIRRVLDRVAGPDHGAKIHSLATATTRSVATGVLGVAFIQAILLGIGFIWAGVPGAGVLAVIVLLLAIMQLPAAIVFIPVIAYIWSTGDSTLSNGFFTVYLTVAGLSDNFLKPLLLGRGVDAPMPVILIGAIGGMVAAGIIGLFIGAVVLAIAYQLFMAWVDDAQPPGNEEEGEAGDKAAATG
jgi:predicted PurR-regulated permease PerM